MLDIQAAEAAFSAAVSASGTAPGAAVAAVRTRRDVITLEGPDAASYLQGQISQNAEALAVGASAPTLLLQPQGRLDAWGRLSRLGPELFWFDLEAGFGPAAVDRLNRFKLRVKLTIELLGTLDVVAVRGPGAEAGPAALGFAAGDGPAGDGPAGDGPVVLDWAEGRERGGIGFDLVDVARAGLTIPAGVPEAPPEALEALRIRLGLPAMGHELDASTIPAAAGVVAMSVDFTKGCYVGQELVARLDSRGSHTPTQLWGLRLDQPADVGAGAEVRRQGEVVGELTSYAPASAAGPVALAYLKRTVTEPGPAEVVTAAGGSVPARIVPLPIAAGIS